MGDELGIVPLRNLSGLGESAEEPVRAERGGRGNRAYGRRVVAPGKAIRVLDYLGRYLRRAGMSEGYYPESAYHFVYMLDEASQGESQRNWRRPLPECGSVLALWGDQNSNSSGLAHSTCRGVQNIGKPCGKTACAV